MTTLSVMTDDGCRSLMEHGAVPVKHVGSDLPTRINVKQWKVLLGDDWGDEDVTVLVV